jgi:hypothetical protein
MISVFQVGDLVNKGPKSVEVISFVRNSALNTVRGNHEERVLEVLNMPVDERPEKYRYLQELSR